MSPEKPTNIYERKDTLENELERLKGADFKHPQFASTTLLKDAELSNKIFVDIGSGTDPNLSRFVTERHGTYTALDYNLAHLKSMKDSAGGESEDIFFVRGDIKSLPLKRESADVTHERFVLMHLPPEDRKTSVKEILAATKDEAMFLEYNWEPLKSETHPDLIAEFKEIASEIMKKLKIESEMGKLLSKEVAEAAKDLQEEFEITETKFERSGRFGKEILAMIKSLKEVSEKVFKDEPTVNRLSALSEKIEVSLSELEMVPPDINAVTVKRKR